MSHVNELIRMERKEEAASRRDFIDTVVEKAVEIMLPYSDKQIMHCQSGKRMMFLLQIETFKKIRHFWLFYAS